MAFSSVNYECCSCFQIDRRAFQRILSPQKYTWTLLQISSLQSLARSIQQTVKAPAPLIFNAHILTICSRRFICLSHLSPTSLQHTSPNSTSSFTLLFYPTLVFIDGVHILYGEGIGSSCSESLWKALNYDENMKIKDIRLKRYTYEFVLL